MPLWHVDYLSWRRSRPSRFKKIFCFSLNYLKESRQGSWPRKGAITRNKFYLNDLPACQEKHLITNHLVFSSSCELPFSSLSPQARPRFLAQKGILTSIAWHVLGSHIHLWCPPHICNLFSPVNLFCVNLIVKPAEELRRVKEECFLPHNVCAFCAWLSCHNRIRLPDTVPGRTWVNKN